MATLVHKLLWSWIAEGQKPTLRDAGVSYNSKNNKDCNCRPLLLQALAEMSTDRIGSDWIRTEANFGRIRTGSYCNFFENWRIRIGSDWENIFCFNVIILNVSKILVVIRFYGVATSLVVLRWLCDSPRTGCGWRTTPYIYVARTSNNRVIMACELYCCLLTQCEALRILLPAK